MAHRLGQEDLQSPPSHTQKHMVASLRLVETSGVTRVESHTPGVADRVRDPDKDNTNR